MSFDLPSANTPLELFIEGGPLASMCRSRCGDLCIQRKGVFSMNDGNLSLAKVMSLGNAGVSHLDYQLADTPWDSKRFALGAGIDVVTGEIAKTAVEPFEVDKGFTQDVEFKYQMVRSETEMESVIDVSTKGKYNIKAVDIGESTEFLQEVSYSETRHTVIARLVIGSPTMRVAEPSAYRLTEDAQKLMRGNPRKFREVYGDYFISGQTRRAEFMVVYSFYATDSGRLRDITSHLDVSVEGLFSKEGTVKLHEKTRQSGVNVSISVHMLGLGEAAKLKDRPSPGQLPDIAEALAWFVKHAVGRAETAQFTHYSLFDSHFPATVEVPADHFSALKQLYGHLWLLRSRFHGMPEHYQRDVRDRFTRLESNITARKGELAKDPAQVAKLDEEACSLLHDIQLVCDRKDFYLRVLAAREAEGEQLRGEKSAKRQQSWMYGLSSDLHTEAVVIQREEKTFREGFRHPLGSKRKGNLSFGDGSNRLIVGMQVRSNWSDGTGGTWRTDQSHFLLEHHATVHVESEGSRGCDWTAVCYYVDANLYRFG